jgi:hypothetical protein
MAILERVTFKVINDQWDAVLAQEKEWEALEIEAGGFPKKRRYRAISGALSGDTFVYEREWESFAAIEAALGRLFAFPKARQLSDAGQSMKADQRMEFYSVLSV